MTTFKKSYYITTHNIAIVCEDYDLTVNFNDPLPYGYGYIHINHIPEKDLKYIMNPKNGIIDEIYSAIRSGYVTYPLVKFNEKFIESLEEL